MYIRLFLITTILLLLGLRSELRGQVSLVKITEEMVTNESGSGDCMSWFDEPDLNKTPITRWITSGNVNCWPAGLVIDLKRVYRIHAIHVFDASKSYRVEGGYLKISGGRPFEWGDSITQPLCNAGRWIEVNCPMETRYIQLQKNATVMCNLDGRYPENCDLAISEILIEGEPVGEVETMVRVVGKRPEPCSMDLFIGMNSYINTPDKVHEAVGCVREYRPWDWNGVTDLQTPISWATLPDGNSDEYYRKLKNMGVECIPCIHRHVDEKNQAERIPHFGGDPAKPETYRIMADYSYQYAARYGSRKIPDHLLRTTEAAPKKSGLGLIRYFENWNEGNREWGDPQEHFNPYVFSAFCSASYDGHLGTMGEGFGVKQADPDMKYVFGGLAGLSLSYIQAMKLWSDYYRNGSFPADVINVHHYCNTRNKQHPKETAYGISPEEDGLKEKLEKLVKWRNVNLPDKEIWLTEFGWDTDSSTYQSAAQGHKLYPERITMNEIQGQWLVRAFLAGSAAGLDRMMMFLANDIKGYTLGVYGSCGFYTVEGEYKPSWYYVKTMKAALAGMVFDAECPSGDKDVCIYRYEDRATGKLGYALWCSTNDGTCKDRYQLRLNYPSVREAVLVSLVDKKEYGEKTKLPVRDGMVEVDVSERPVFVLIDRPEVDTPLAKVETVGDFITCLSPYYAVSWAKDGAQYSELKVPSSDPAYSAAMYSDRLFDEGWKFREDAPADASGTSFDDSDWRTLTLPHDFSIERRPSPFRKDIKDSISTGNIPGGTGWYRKHFTLDEWTARQQIHICFDGVMERSDVWINGHHLGFHPNGYMPFSYDLTPFLYAAGQENLIAVRAFNPGDNSRWYSGSGIYRHVRLKVSGKIYIPDNEVQIVTPEIAWEKANVDVTFPLLNTTEQDADVTVQLTLVRPDGTVLETKEYSAKIDANGSEVLRLTTQVDQPELWSVDSPALYEARIRVTSSNETTDFYQTTFGIRSLKFSAAEGFLLNGVPLKLKGACLHHDNGLLGAAAYDAAEIRKVRLMKQNGFNAIRTSHNPPSSQFLDACDRLGMLVIDEAFDMWEHPKRDRDYHLFFREHAVKDLTSLVKRDRNHPSVIIWSIGNEIYERADTSGLRIAAELISVVKSLDATRPVTQGICDFWEQKGRTWEETAPAYALLDVCGYNYETKHYLSDSKTYPSRIMVGTESFPVEALENWEATNRYPFVLGDFVWTGMDYIGEVGIGNFSYIGDDRPYSTPTRSWPWYLSNCGDLDICGGKKPQSFFRDVVWGRSDLELLVHAPIPAGKQEVLSKWGWPDEHPHWNWKGNEGKKLSVCAYSSCDSVKLYLNNKILATKAVSDQLKVDFDVSYSPGCLLAVGIKDGCEVVHKFLQTVGRPHHIVILPEKTTVSAEPNDLVFVEIRIVDEAGHLVTDGPVRLKLSVEEEGVLLASGNAAPNDMKSFRNSACTTYQGKCQAILQPGRKSGTMRLKVLGEGLPTVETTINIASVKYVSF